MSVNIFCSKWLDLLNKVCIYWTGASVIIILVVLLSMADDTRRNAEFVFTHYDASASGWYVAIPYPKPTGPICLHKDRPAGWAFFVGLLMPAYVLTGYGMVAALCEEVANPEREVPKAIVLSVAAAGVTGVIYLIPILFVLPDVKVLLAVANGQPIGPLFKTVTGSTSGGFGLLFLILRIHFFAGTVGWMGLDQVGVGPILIKERARVRITVDCGFVVDILKLHGVVWRIAQCDIYQL